jgi:hypothetical protein
MEREPARELLRSSCGKSPFGFLRNRFSRAGGQAGRQASSLALHSAAFSAGGFISYGIRVHFGFGFEFGTSALWVDEY